MALTPTQETILQKFIDNDPELVHGNTIQALSLLQQEQATTALNAISIMDGVVTVQEEPLYTADRPNLVFKDNLEASVATQLLNTLGSTVGYRNSDIKVSSPVTKTVGTDGSLRLGFDDTQIENYVDDEINSLSASMAITVAQRPTSSEMDAAIATAIVPLATTAALTAATTDKVSQLTRASVLNSINVTSPLTISQNSAGDITLGSIANQYRRWASLDLGSYVILPIERNGNTVNCCWCTPLTGQQNAYNDWVIQSNKLPKSLTPTEGYAYLIGSAGNYTLVLRFGTDGSIYQMNYNQTIPSGLNVAWQGRWTTTNPISVD